uniref:Uncharacterized protein n=1 Tax=Pseudomonas aeruginosa TaxID=287 RepID=A0A5E5R4N7_PSEAI|nr:hypothetical protein TUEID40_04450 [Pseudomonas aeruginosa]
MRAFAGLLCGLLGLVPGAAAYEPDVFGTAGRSPARRSTTSAAAVCPAAAGRHRPS